MFIRTATIKDLEIVAAVEAQCAVPAAAYERVAEKLTTLCDGRIDCVTVEEGYMPWPDEETAEMDG